MTPPSENKTEATLRQRILSALTSGLDALLANLGVQIFLVLLFGVGAAVILTPGLRKKGPELTEADVGRPARKDVKASRTFQYTPPPEVLEKRRDEAAARIVTVYNYYPNRLRLGYESLSLALRDACDPEGLFDVPSVPKKATEGPNGPAVPRKGTGSDQSAGKRKRQKARGKKEGKATRTAARAREESVDTKDKKGEKKTSVPAAGSGEDGKTKKLDPERKL